MYPDFGRDEVSKRDSAVGYTARPGAQSLQDHAREMETRKMKEHQLSLQREMGTAARGDCEEVQPNIIDLVTRHLNEARAQAAYFARRAEALEEVYKTLHENKALRDGLGVMSALGRLGIHLT